jgi:hypothetical protein
VETFVVRVFVAAGDEPVPFAGIVEHVGTGRALSFRDRHEFIRTVLRELGRYEEISFDPATSPETQNE